MQVLRGHKYKIYPSEEMELVLLDWERAHRFVWNNALSQRLLRRRQGKGVRGDEWWRLPPLDYFYQQKKLTKLRARHEWLGATLCRSNQAVLRSFDRAWELWLKDPDRERPRFKQRHDSVGMMVATCSKEIDPEKHIKDGMIRLPKIGWVKIYMHRPLRGVPKGMSISRDGNEWYVSILCEVNISDPGRSPLPAVGIDRGVVLNIADSDGHVSTIPERIRRLARRIDRMKSRNDRKIKSHERGVPRSANWKKTRAKISKLERQVARMRKNWLHRRALYYADNYGVVVIEDLKVKNMTKSAKGTKEDPGKRVKQKAGLNRSILQQGWSDFVFMLCYKMEERGGIVVKVPPMNTSITCQRCRCSDKNNRRSQSKFKCVECGYEDNADINAAKEILRRYKEGKFEKEGGYQARKKPKNKTSLFKRKKKSCTEIPLGKSQTTLPVPEAGTHPL